MGAQSIGPDCKDSGQVTTMWDVSGQLVPSVPDVSDILALSDCRVRRVSKSVFRNDRKDSGQYTIHFVTLMTLTFV